MQIGGAHIYIYIYWILGFKGDVQYNDHAMVKEWHRPLATSRTCFCNAFFYQMCIVGIAHMEA
jgi:hypothetical protein